MATYPADKVLASGRIAYIDAKGKAELARCSWLVEVRTNHPEPDFPSDLYRIEECGAALFALDGDIDAGWHCSNGHRHLTYGSPAQIAEERLEAQVELAAAHDPRLAARLDAGETWQEVLGR